MPKLLDRLPAALPNRLRTRFGTQFVKFAMVAALSLGASEIALFLFIGPMHMTGGVSGVTAGAIGAVVSYLLSRRAWGRSGRPNVIRETIPFWMVSVGAWLVLGLATKLGLHIATSLDLHHLRRHLVVGGVYFLANCVTFMARFLIFHYILFADRDGKGGRGQPPSGLIDESLSPVTVPVAAQSPEDQRR